MKCIKLFLFILLGLFVFSLDVKAEGCSATCYYELYKYDEPDYLLAKFKVLYDGVKEPKIEIYDEAYGVNDPSVYPFSNYIFVNYPEVSIPLTYLQKSKDDPTLHCPNLYWAYADAMSDSYSVSFDQKDVMDDEYDEEGAKMVLKPTEESKVDNSSCKADVPEDEEYEVLPHCSYVNNEFKEKFSFQIRKNKNTNEIDIINISHDWTGVNYAVYSEFEFKNFEFKCPSYLSFEENKALGAFHSGDFLVTPSNTETDWKYVGETNYASDNKILLSYVEYSGSGKLQCSKGGSSVINCEKEGQLIEIGSIDKYIDILSGTNVENYPRYIVEYVDENNNYTYKFADYSDKDANVNYINLKHIGDLFKTGEDGVDETCGLLLGNDFLNFLNNNVLKIIYIGIPILLIVLTTFDFAKVVFIDDKDGIGAAGKKFGKRVIAAFLIYLVPTILIFATNVFGNNEIEKCAQTLKQLSENYNG